VIGAEFVVDAARVARFLQGLRAFHPRADDVFISSYPRSGTTWLQHITHALRSGGDLSFDHINDSVPWFERQLALGRCTAADFAALPSPRLFKSHLPRVWLPRRTRYIYIARDGRDVATSYFHFYRSHLRFAGTFDDFFERFLRGQLQYGSWFKHVAGWRTTVSDPDQLTLSYEQLQAALPAELRRIAQFCGVELPGPRQVELEAHCSFSFMKRHEAKFDHAAREPNGAATAAGQFIREGQTGGFAELFDAAHDRRFHERLRASIRLPTLELRLPAFLH
jgi:Sulfotransferase domain